MKVKIKIILILLELFKDAMVSKLLSLSKKD